MIFPWVPKEIDSGDFRCYLIVESNIEIVALNFNSRKAVYQLLNCCNVVNVNIIAALGSVVCAGADHNCYIFKALAAFIFSNFGCQLNQICYASVGGLEFDAAIS